MSRRLPPAYSAEDLALFAKYKPIRAKLRPFECDERPGCWVELGPPGTPNGCGGAPRCGACKGKILLGPVLAHHQIYKRAPSPHRRVS
jgi:hypothetical protein